MEGMALKHGDGRGAQMGGLLRRDEEKGRRRRLGGLSERRNQHEQGMEVSNPEYRNDGGLGWLVGNMCREADKKSQVVRA